MKKVKVYLRRETSYCIGDTATGVTPNNPNDTILKNNNQLISIKNIQNLYIYDF